MKKVLILSGAGLSAESGLRTFRDSDGLWEEYDIEEVCSARGFRANRQKVLDFYDKRRAQLAECEPNEAHRMIARIKAKYPEQIAVLTQNVDDLLERAGCVDVVHLHGFLPEIYCEHCKKIEYIGYEAINTKEHFAKNSILNNLDKSDIDHAFNKCYIEKATTAAPKIEADIEKFFS